MSKLWLNQSGRMIEKDGKLITCSKCPCEPPLPPKTICDLHIVFSGYIDYFLWSPAPETDTVVTSPFSFEFGFWSGIGGDAPETCDNSACFRMLWDSSSTCEVTGPYITSYSMVITSTQNITISPLIIKDIEVTKQHGSGPDYSLRFTADVRTKCKCWGYVPSVAGIKTWLSSGGAHGTEFWSVSTSFGKVPGEGSVTLEKCNLIEDELQ